MYSNQMIAGRYRTSNEVGKGAFARVFRAFDTHKSQPVALKILKREYARDAVREVEVLKSVVRNDPEGRQRVCRMQSHFTYEGQPCMIFTLYGPALRSRKFGAQNKPELAKFAKQMAQALDFLHYNCRIVHTDLKPENILLDSPNPGPSGLGDGWQICDLGSASFFKERPDKELITTRPYRAPEVILVSGWCYPADMFSLGVILYEVFTGRTVFECTRYCDSDQQHLQQMERRLGQFPSWAVDGASSSARGAFFDHAGNVRQGHIGAQGSQPVSVSDPELQDLISRLLHYDPVTRLRADEVLHHPFVTRHTGPPHDPVHSQMPANGYTAGYIRTPGCSAQRNGMRAPANKLSPEDTRMEPRGRSASMKVGKDRAGGILGDLTNRPPAGMPSGLGKRVLPAGLPTRPRSGSAAGARLGVGVGAAPTLGNYGYGLGRDVRPRAGLFMYR